MLQPQGLHSDVPRPLVEQLCFGILAPLTVKVCQVVKRIGHLRMLWSHLPFPDADSTLVERFDLHIFALFTIELSQVIKWISCPGMRRSHLLLPDAQCTQKK